MVEERRGGKKIPSLPRTAVQQTRKNEFPAGKQQNFPKSALTASAWPPPFRPHLSCSSVQRSTAGSRGSLGKHALPRERRPRAARLGPSRWEGKGRPGAAVAVSLFCQRTRGLTGARAAHGHGNSPCLQPRPPRWLLHTARRTRAAGSRRAAPGGQRGQPGSLPPPYCKTRSRGLKQARAGHALFPKPRRSEEEVLNSASRRSLGARTKT